MPEPEKQKQKRRPKIDDKVKLKLWLKSGGRCEYRNCNQILFEDSLTYKDLNQSYIAHIYGYAPESARYDVIESPKLEKDFSNLMLLCDACHRKIDREEKDQHPANLLFEMKKEHEDRIEYLTGIKENVRTHMVLYSAKIGKFNPPMDQEAMRQVLVGRNRFPHKDAIVIGPDSSIIEDGQELFWAYESEALEKAFSQNVQPRLKSDGQHFSVFPFAPMPLLIKLGVLLGNQHGITVYQHHREPHGWAWNDTGVSVEFNLLEPADKTGTPVLNISLSADIDDSRITEVLPAGDLSIWRLTIDSPRLDFLKTEQNLSDFRIIARDAFARIKDAHGHDNELHIFPAMPPATAVELGRAWMPKVDLPMVVYDGREKFNETLKIKRS